MAGHSGGGGHGSAQFAEALAERSALNQKTMVYFATALAVMMGIFITFHITRTIAQKLGFTSGSSVLAVPFVFVSRYVAAIHSTRSKRTAAR